MTTEPASPASASPGHALPESTLWPAFLALGSTLLLWGMISSAILTTAGAALFALSLWGWIGDIRHERKKHGSDHRS